MTPEQLNEYRLELLRERIKVEADISRSLFKLVRLAESCIENSPWAGRIMNAVYMERAEKK